MKRILIFILPLLLLSACTKDYETVFSDSADQRVRGEMQALKTTLLNSDNGWLGYIYTGTGPGFVFFLEFDEEGYVRIISDFNESTGSQVQRTTYAIKGLQQPTLSFDTYSYIHLLADPSGSVNGGENGTGLISDFEFYLQEATGDSLKLMGIKNRVPMTLVKATAQERTKFLNGEVGEIVAITDNYFETNQYPWVQVGNVKMAVELDSATKIFSFLYLDQANNVIALRSLFTYSTDGLKFQIPLQLGSSSVQEVHWDANLTNFYIVVNSQRAYFQQSNEPVIPLVYALGFIHQFVVMDESIEGYTSKLPPAFMNIYNQAKTGVYNIENYQLDLIAFILEFDPSNNVNMYYFVRNSTGTYRARFTYTMTVSNTTKKATFTFVSRDFNAEVIEPGLRPLLDYFKNNTFTLNYYQDSDFGAMAGFYPEQTPAAIFYGLLE